MPLVAGYGAPMPRLTAPYNPNVHLAVRPIAPSGPPLPRSAVTVSGAATVRVFERAERDDALTAMMPASLRVKREREGPQAGVGRGGRHVRPPMAASPPAKRPREGTAGVDATDGSYLAFLEDMKELGAV